MIKKKRKNRGFTLVEVLIAAAILSLVVTPILSSFVTIARVNAKSRRRLSATTIANGVMESVKGFELAEIAKQCDFTSVPAYVIAGSAGTATELDPSDLTTAKTSVTIVDGEYTFNASTDGRYAFSFTSVPMDGTTYDVLLVYTKNEARSNETVTIPGEGEAQATTKTTDEVLGTLGVRVLTYYDVDVKVFSGGAGFSSTPLAHITGTKADYN